MEGHDPLTVANAARHAGVSVSTIRRWMDVGNLEFKVTDQGWRVTSKEALMRYLSRHPHENHRAVGGATAGTYRESVMKPSHERGGERHNEALRVALEALEHERRVSEGLRTQNRELQSQLVKLAAEMQAVLSKDTDGMLSRWFRK